MIKTKNLIVIVGPTAVGKTELCVSIAKELSTDIVSADSRQFYKELNVGTAKPSVEEMGGVTHHLLNNMSIEKAYDVGQYENDALEALESLFKKHQNIILTGGSGLYIDAVCNGIDKMPDIPSELRQELNSQFQNNGIEPLRDKLKSLDESYYQQVDLNNPQRVIRALEVCIASGKTYSSFRKASPVKRPFNIIKIGLDREREELYTRIDQRMDEMIKKGLFEEAKSLHSHRSKNALQTVGYKEVFDFMDGQYDKEEAVRLLKRNSRRYAKRQMTWFRGDRTIRWFHPNDEVGVLDFIKEKST